MFNILSPHQSAASNCRSKTLHSDQSNPSSNRKNRDICFSGRSSAMKSCAPTSTRTQIETSAQQAENFADSAQQLSSSRSWRLTTSVAFLLHVKALRHQHKLVACKQDTLTTVSQSIVCLDQSLHEGSAQAVQRQTNSVAELGPSFREALCSQIAACRSPSFDSPQWSIGSCLNETVFGCQKFEQLQTTHVMRRGRPILSETSTKSLRLVR